MNKKDWKEHEELVETLRWSLHYAKKYIEEAPVQKHSSYYTVKCFEKAREVLKKANKKLEKHKGGRHGQE